MFYGGNLRNVRFLETNFKFPGIGFNLTLYTHGIYLPLLMVQSVHTIHGRHFSDIIFSKRIAKECEVCQLWFNSHIT